ncbi:MAG: amidohydrolase family protein [Candidatus Sericytochromatia bacterium]|nr:amidohydrolase family protein [Candidatus Sericytochromatia bacterium]
MSETVFTKVEDLARLPWFGLNEAGRITVTDPSVGPVIDMHTHLALAFIMPMQHSLHRSSAETQHYMPSCCSFDLDVYANKNMTHNHLKSLKRDLVIGGITGLTPMRKTHTIPNLVREMDDLNVVKSVILAIDMQTGLSKNWFHAAQAAKDEPKLIGYGSVHPHDWGNIGDRLDTQAHAGCVGIKAHPMVQGFRPDDPAALDLFRLCGDRGLPMLIHCGPAGIEPPKRRARLHVKFYEKALADNPKTTFILGHAGALEWEAALKLSLKYPNAYLEISSQSLSAVKQMVATANPDRIVFGSDWPWYHQAWPLAKVCLATQDKPDIRTKILYRNAADLLKLEK